MKVTVFNGYPERFGKYKLAILGRGTEAFALNHVEIYFWSPVMFECCGVEHLLYLATLRPVPDKENIFPDKPNLQSLSRMSK